MKHDSFLNDQSSQNFGEARMRHGIKQPPSRLSWAILIQPGIASS